MATRVLILEQDVTLRETLELLLEDAGYATIGVGEEDLARWALRLSPHPLIVLIGHGSPLAVGLSLIEEADTLPPHAYIVLSTNPRAAPSVHNGHTQRTVPVVEVPSDVDVLLDAVAEAGNALNATLQRERDQDASMSGREPPARKKFAGGIGVACV